MAAHHVSLSFLKSVTCILMYIIHRVNRQYGYKTHILPVHSFSKKGHVSMPLCSVQYLSCCFRQSQHNHGIDP